MSAGERGRATRILRPHPWLWVCVASAACLFICGAVWTWLHAGWTWLSIAYVALSLFGFLGVVETAVTRIVLADTTLHSVSLFYRRSYPAADIESVTWAAGAGVSVKLAAGGWAKIPDIGYNSQGLANTLRAWLKRAKSPSSTG